MRTRVSNTTETAHCITRDVPLEYDFFGFDQAVDNVMAIRDVRKIHIHSMPHGFTAIYRNVVKAAQAISHVKNVVGNLV